MAAGRVFRRPEAVPPDAVERLVMGRADNALLALCSWSRDESWELAGRRQGNELCRRCDIPAPRNTYSYYIEALEFGHEVSSILQFTITTPTVQSFEF